MANGALEEGAADNVPQVGEALEHPFPRLLDLIVFHHD